MTLTFLNAKPYNKKPYSPYTDKDANKFIFANETFNDLKSVYKEVDKNFVLSSTLDINEPILTYRRISDLKEYFSEKLDIFFIDIDNVTNKEDYFSVIEYFRKKKYAVLLYKSLSFNNKDSFNLKVLIKVDITNKKEIKKALLLDFQKDLPYVSIDLSASSYVSVQSPPYNNFIIYHNEDGYIINDSDIYIENIKEVLGKEYAPEIYPDITFNSKVQDECIKIFHNLGFSPIKGNMNDNGSINFKHPNEVKSKGGYFWFSSNPLIMNHNNSEKSVSIFNIFKETEIGKEWLRFKTKEEQKNELIRYNPSHKDIIVNERYLDYTKKDKLDMLDNFLEDDLSVIKICSPMGSAKSSAIEKCINKSHNLDYNVIIVSNRVSVAKDYAEKYDLMLYQDINAHKHKGSIVVQYDSLYRFQLSNYDVVIFDEFASLLLHHRAGLSDNSNINAVKFKILLETKKVLIADAFLTGYEDLFFKDRNIYSLYNNYRDDIDLYEYTNKGMFVKELVNYSCNLNEGEHISASFTSLNMMKLIHLELQKNGVKSVMLSSETSELTREIIYNRFKEDTHNAFDVILYTPTLTVGVSNLNNIIAHFHYDTGMSTDVISSLQMIKRSRTSNEIHYYLEERQFYYDTDLDSINRTAEQNINNFYSKKDKTLLIDIDYSTGDLKLTDLARYINKIEVFYNILESNHANAFRLLLKYQFSNTPLLIKEEDNSINIKEKIKNLKVLQKEEYLKIINEYQSSDWLQSDIDRLKTKTTELTDEEKSVLLKNEIISKFKNIPEDLIDEITYKEIESDFKYISKIKNLKIALKSFNNDTYANYTLSSIISSDIYSLQNKTHIKFLEYLIRLGRFRLSEYYTVNDIKSMDNSFNLKYFEKFLKRIGYSWKDYKLIIDKDLFKYINYI